MSKTRTEQEIDERLKELEAQIEKNFVDEEGMVNIYDVQSALMRHLAEDEDELLAKGPYLGGGDLAGWRDSNKTLAPADLVGRIYTAGILSEMRQSSDVIAPSLNALKARVASLEYKVVPEHEDPSEKDVIAAQGVEFILRNMPYLSLEKFISDVWDDRTAYGFSLWEIQFPTEGPDAFKLHLHRIAPWQVYEWNLNEDRNRLDSVRIDNGDGLVTVPAGKLVWFGEKTFPGNYWGYPTIRPAVAAYSAYKEDIKNYLGLRRMQKGVLIAQETGAGSNRDSWNAVRSWLRRYYQGQSLPLLLNEGMNLEHLAVTQPGIDSYDKMLTYWDSKLRGALDDALFNLGADGIGSLALGKEISAEAQRRIVSKISQFLDIINGKTDYCSDLLAVITELIGFDRKHTPCIVVIDNTENDHSENALALAGLIKDGVLTREDVGEENIKRIIEALGGSTDHLEEEETTTSQMSEGQAKTTCPHCDKTGGHSVMHRWHFDNCKHRQNDLDEV